MNIDLKDIGPRLAEQFQGLQGRHPGQWPLAPRVLCAAGVMALVTGLGYFFYWSGQFEQQERLAAEESRLRDEYRIKMAQAINLDALQLETVAKTFRYLDSDEISAQKKARKGKKPQQGAAK